MSPGIVEIFLLYIFFTGRVIMDWEVKDSLTLCDSTKKDDQPVSNRYANERRKKTQSCLALRTRNYPSPSVDVDRWWKAGAGILSSVMANGQNRRAARRAAKKTTQISERVFEQFCSNSSIHGVK